MARNATYLKLEANEPACRAGARGGRFILEVPEAGLNCVAWLKRKQDFPRVRRVTLEIGVKPSLDQSGSFGKATRISAPIHRSGGT